ncbi:MAG: M16 family metallopeptidase [Caldilinea sp.]
MHPLEIVSQTLPNGLQVLLRPSYRAPVASFWIFYRVGSRNESPGHTGISHWVEHMLFKGTPRYPRGQFDKAVARAGGVFNGMTGPDWTVYFETLPADRIELALRVESDRMANAVFDPAETELERTVILSEREGSENDPFYRLHEEVQAAAFLAHSYRNPIIGWSSDLHTLTREALYAHYRTYYTPNQAVVVVTGDFEPDAMLEGVAEHFGVLAAGPEAPSPAFVEPPARAERRVVLRGEEPTAYFLQGFQAPPALHPDFFPFVVLESVLGGAKGMGLFGGSANNRSNRLYRALVEQQLAVDASSSFGPTLDPGLFTISATLAPAVDPQAVEAAIWAELATLQRTGVTDAELQKAIKQTRAQFAYSSESVTYEAYWLGFSQVVASQQWLAGWNEQLLAVRSEDVQRVAQCYLQPERQTVGYYVPLTEEAHPT